MSKEGNLGRGNKCKHEVSQVALVCQCRRYKRHGFNPWVGKIPLREGMTTHSSILSWIIQWMEEPRTYTHKLACLKILKYIYMWVERREWRQEGELR